MTITHAPTPQPSASAPGADQATAGHAAGSTWVDHVRSEGIKFVRTPSSWIGVCLFVLLSVAMAILMASLARGAGGEELTITRMLSGVYGLGQVVAMVIAAVAMTGEYAHGTINRSLLAKPRRWALPVAKAIVQGGVWTVAAATACVLSLGAAAAIAGPGSRPQMEFSAIAPPVATTIVLVVAGALLALGVGAILRSTAGTVALLVLWPTMVEGLLARLPGPMAGLSAYLPFVNAGWAVTGTEPFGLTMPWGRSGALTWFVAVSVGLFVLGLVASLRDP